MITTKVKISKIFDNEDSNKISIFCKPLSNRGKLLIDEDFGTIKVNGVFPKGLNEDDIITITINDIPSKAQYYKLLFMGQLPTKETFKDYGTFINNIELNYNLMDRAEKLPVMVSDIKKVYKVISSREDIDDIVLNLKDTKLRKDVNENYKLISILKEKYIHKHNIYKFLRGLEKLGIKEIDVCYKIMKKFENEELPGILKDIKKNPYVLVESGHVSFKVADDIALNVGIKADDDRRILAAAEYNLKKLGDSGKSWSYLGVFTKQLIVGDSEAGIESINTNEFQFKINDLSRQLASISSNLEKSNSTWISKDKKRIASRYYYNIEKELSDIVKKLDNAEAVENISINEVKKAVRACERAEGFKYTDEQKNAVTNALKTNMAVVCGAAGTGKSTVAKIICELYKNNKIVTALSGKAALRISETTGVSGSTMHSILNRTTSEFIDAELIVLDEASMLGIDIVLDFFKKIKPGTRVLILGDDSQLTPIGAGNFFADMLRAKSVNINHIAKIHRQAKESKIIDFATRVRLQQPLEPIEETFKDFKLLLKDDDKAILSATLVGFKSLLKKYPIEETLIVTPYKLKGKVNTFDINNKIQKYLAKHKLIDDSKYKYIKVKDTEKKFKICVNDRVLNTQNNYNLVGRFGQKVAIMNGALGTVIDINKNRVTVDFDGIGEVELKSYDLTNILLGYAITVHKSQGSQAKGVIYVCPSDVGRLGCKEQVYTAVTRAQEYCEVIGKYESLNQCILTKELNSKQTLLTQFLDETEDIKINNVIDVEFREVKKKKVAPKRSKKKKETEEIEVLPGQIYIDEALELANNTKNEKLPVTAEEKKKARYARNNERRRKLRRNEAGLTSRQQSKADLVRKVHELKEQGLKGVEIARELNINKATVSKYLKL